ncbi:MAG TPA: TIGR00730 family Rossman fold protein [Acidimicrobiales bacterium]|nr:TIGR00730 family Rossman fold protein [Acidimicrobiales bacterium]
MVLRRVCVFCGSSDGARSDYAQAAERLGEALAARGIDLVYGGAHVGLMGRLADACRAGGGQVIGVIPERLVDAEVAHTSIDDLRIVGSMHERKALMADLSDGFLALPGGFGTLEEFCEVLTWSQLGLHPVPKPCGLLDVAGYFEPLVTLFDRGVDEGFIRPVHRGLVLASDDVEALLDALAAWTPPPVTRKWVG